MLKRFVATEFTGVTDDRAAMWIHDLELKGKNHRYLFHPDFLPGFQAGYEGYCEVHTDDPPAWNDVLFSIECALSRTNYYANPLMRAAGSYAWHVGSIFGYLAALLESDVSASFSFLSVSVSPVCARLAYRPHVGMV